MTNQYFLKDGRNFIINPDLDTNPTEARRVKKNFLLLINPQDLHTDKLWTVEAVRALGIGLVQSYVEGKKRATKKVLVERLVEYIEHEQKLALLASQSILENLQACDYSPEFLLEMFTRLHGSALVDAIEASILLKGYSTSTIVKTLMPDVVKTINTHYQCDDKHDVIRGLRLKFSAETKQVNKTTETLVARQNQERKPIKFTVLRQYVYGLLENVLRGESTAVEALSWKQLSICLAFATGRRMAEVHGSGTSFEVVDGQLLFKGQLKTKDRGELDAYIIPTLVAPEVVVLMHQRLRSIGKASFTPEDVNKQLSKALSTELHPNIKKVLDDAGVQKYKDLRDVYAVHLLESKPPSMSDSAYIAKYLGHAVDDISTAAAYQKYYLVHDQETA